MYPDRGDLGICLIIELKAGVLRGRPFTQPRLLPYTKVNIAEHMYIHTNSKQLINYLMKIESKIDGTTFYVVHIKTDSTVV